MPALRGIGERVVREASAEDLSPYPASRTPDTTSVMSTWRRRATWQA